MTRLCILIRIKINSSTNTVDRLSADCVLYVSNYENIKPRADAEGDRAWHGNSAINTATSLQGQ